MVLFYEHDFCGLKINHKVEQGTLHMVSIVVVPFLSIALG